MLHSQCHLERRISEEWAEQLLPSREENQWLDTWQLQICMQFNSWKQHTRKLQVAHLLGPAHLGFVNYCGLIKKKFFIFIIINFKRYLFLSLVQTQILVFNILKFYWISDIQTVCKYMYTYILLILTSLGKHNSCLNK